MDADSALKEYQELRGEIGRNSQLTASAFTVAATATAALMGYGIQSQNWLVFLSPFAVLLPSLWFVSSQLESTVRIATYIQVFVEPEIGGLGWETRLRRLRDVTCKGDSRYTMSITGIYGAMAAASLALAWLFVDDTPEAIAALAVLTLFLGGLTFMAVRSCRACFCQEKADAFLAMWKQVKSLDADGPPPTMNSPAEEGGDARVH